MRAQGVIVALQLGNEPALNTAGYNEAIRTYYAAAMAVARKSLPSLPLVMSFIPPNDEAVPAFVRALNERHPSTADAPRMASSTY